MSKYFPPILFALFCIVFHPSLFGGPPLEGGILPHYQQFATGSIYLPEVISELSSKERKQLVNHIIDTAKRGYLNTNAAVDCNQEAQWEQIHTYLPIQIIRTRDTSGAAKLSICTPEDLEELAGVEIISYGKFPHAQQSDADVVTGIVWAQ